MASIRKPTYSAPIPEGAKIVERDGKRFARFTKDGKAITAPLTKDGHKCRIACECWYARYKDENGKWQEVKGYTDRDATMDLAAELQRKAARRKQGLDDPCEDQLTRPLSQHVDDFEKVLSSKWCERHVAGVVGHVRRIVADCKFTKIGDIQASRVEMFLGDLRADGNSIQTANHYLRAIKQFCRWLVKDRRTRENPVSHLDTSNAETDRRRIRRALSPEEIQWLLKTTKGRGDSFRGLLGIDRYVVYCLALGSGLRASEIASLTPESFRLEADPPIVVVEAGTSKRRRRDEQPLQADVAGVLRAYLADCPTGERVWRGLQSDKTAKMLRADLEAARAAWIDEAKTDQEKEAREQSDFLAYQNAAGEYIDFHATRHTYATEVYKRVPGKLGRDLVRHSCERLADRYTHLGLRDLGEAASRLASLVPPRDDQGRQEARATGTDGKPRQPSNSFPYLPKESGPKGHFEAQEGTGASKDLQSSDRPQVLALQPQTVTSQADGARFERASELPPKQFSRQAVESRKHGGNEVSSPPLPTPAADPDLARVVAVWGSLPSVIKKAILALVGTVEP